MILVLDIYRFKTHFICIDICIVVTYLGLQSLALPVFGSFRYLTLACKISDEDSLSEIALSGASKLASTYFTLFYRSVHVLYTGICILGGCLC